VTNGNRSFVEGDGERRHGRGAPDSRRNRPQPDQERKFGWRGGDNPPIEYRVGKADNMRRYVAELVALMSDLIRRPQIFSVIWLS
jgi:hypothetical protein